MMKCSVATVAMIIALFTGQAMAEEIAIVVHPSNPIEKLTLDEVKRIFSDITLTWENGARIKPFDLMISDMARQKFSQDVLQRRPEDVAYEWANKKITNTAINAPETVKSQILMLMKVSGDKNAIGYMPMSEVNPGKVKVVLTLF
jgi:ABC-type phosphate transport system substrate-binding protein